MPELDYIQLEQPDAIDIEKASEKAFEKLGLPRLGGASGRGWSRFRVLQECPQKYYWRYIRKLKSDARAALEVGSSFHAFSALYYLNMMRLLSNEDEYASPSDLRDALLEVGANADYIGEGWRLFDAYADFYEGHGDYLTPLAVEELGLDEESGRSCRYDLIAKIEPAIANQRGIAPGTWVVEHKTSAHLGESVVEGWHLDGEVIGQIALWNKSGMSRKFGKLQGVIVNIVTKHKQTQFHRELVCTPIGHVRRQWRDLGIWEMQEKLYETMGHWPRSLAACYGSKFGKCDYAEICKRTCGHKAMQEEVGMAL